MAPQSENSNTQLLAASARTVPEAVHFKPAPKVAQAVSSIERLATEAVTASSAAKVPVLASSMVGDALTSSGREKQQAPIPLSGFQARFVKVKDGVAHIVGNVGNVLLYIQAQTTGAATSIKVWILETSNALQVAFQTRTGAWRKQLSAAVSAAKARGWLFVEPVYAKVTEGVLYVYGSIRGALVSFQAKASQIWVACSTRLLATYDFMNQKIVGCVRPIVSNVTMALSSAQVKVFTVVEPCYAKTKAGVLHVRTNVNGMVVYVKVGVCERGDRVKMAALAAYTKVSSFVGDYTNPVFAKAISMYEVLRTKVMAVLGPYLTRASDGCAYAKAQICGVAVAIKVRTLPAYHRAAGMSSFCVLTVKDGFVHVRGNLGDKMLYIKIRLVDFMDHIKVVAADAQQTAAQQLAVLRDQTQSKLVALKDGALIAAADQNVQVTTAASVAGAVTVGGAGFAAGGAFGAAAGVPLALFSFGLSIPLGAAIGAGAGLCAGVVTGGAVGGASGHKIHQKKDDITKGVHGVVAKANSYREFAVEKAGDCRGVVADRTAVSAAYVRARLVAGAAVAA